MADVLVNGSVDDNSYKVSPTQGPVWISKLIGYFIEFPSTAGEELRLLKTTDGGATWPTTYEIDATSGALLAFAIWFDKWTKDNTGTVIHIVWQGETTPGTTRDGLWYRGFNTATDTFVAGSININNFAAQTSAQDRTSRTIAITRSRGGNLYIGLASNRTLAAGNTQVFFYRSVDAGVTWVARADFAELTGNGSNDYWLLMPGNDADNQDIWAAYMDISANEVSLKVHDDSANTWAETSVDAVGLTLTGSEFTRMMQASIRHSDGHMILLVCTREQNATGDLRVYDINGAASIVAKADALTNAQIVGTALTFDQNTDYIYVFYGDMSGGVTAIQVRYKKSTDGGATWGAAVQVTVTARAWWGLSADWSIGSYEGRLLAVFQEDATFDVYTNTDNALDLLKPGVTYGFAVDWNNDGDFVDANEDILADVKRMVWERGVESELEGIGTGVLGLTVRNETGKYSPENTASVLYPNVLPGRPIRIQAIHLGTTYTLFTGYIERIVPHPRQDVQDCEILCVDGMDRLARAIIEAPSRGIIADVKMGAATQVSGVNITFANANPDTITRASGSFVTDGFQVGMRVKVAGSTSNNSGSGTIPLGFVIATVAALVLTLHADESLTAEGPVAGVTLDGYGPMGIILDEVAWPAAKRSLDAGVDTMALWWVHREKALDAIHKLLKAEKSLAFVKGDGTFVYEDRHHRLKSGLGGATDHLTSQGTFSDTMVDMQYEVSTRPVRNIAQVTGHKRVVTTLAQLWGTQDRLRIGQGEVLTVWAHLDDPAKPINAPATDGTDYGISATSGGVDSATLRASVATVFTVYGQSVKMQFTNNNTQEVYIVAGSTGAPDGLYIDGQAYGDDEAFAREEDATSKTAYGARSIEVDNPFTGDFNTLTAYAQWLVSRFKGINAAGTLVPIPDAVQMELMNGSSALLTQILAREISDRITVTATELGISAKEYYINKMRHEVSNGGKFHKATWDLERVDESKYWLLGIVGYSELGTTTRIGF